MIIHVYKTYPPKNKAEIPTIEKLKSFSDEEVVKYLLKFSIFQYHPDKNRVHKDEKWIVLCDQITKYLNEIRMVLCE
jgi:hypothetical protein